MNVLQIEQSTDPILAALVALDTNMAKLAVELHGITLGYIGNCERWGDDRAWGIFLPHPGRIGGPADSVSLGATAGLPEAVCNWLGLESTARRRYNLQSRVA